MLTGLLRPSAGTCTVMGHDVLRAAAHARQHIGYCPQANVLFGSLTVWEHLLLFCAIKGLSGGAFSAAANAASAQIIEVPYPLLSIFTQHCFVLRILPFQGATSRR
jgi:ABC-type multidrug transport system ATPase subunit